MKHLWKLIMPKHSFISQDICILYNWAKKKKFRSSKELQFTPFAIENIGNNFQKINQVQASLCSNIYSGEGQLWNSCFLQSWKSPEEIEYWKPSLLQSAQNPPCAGWCWGLAVLKCCWTSFSTAKWAQPSLDVQTKPVGWGFTESLRLKRTLRLASPTAYPLPPCSLRSLWRLHGLLCRC